MCNKVRDETVRDVLLLDCKHARVTGVTLNAGVKANCCMPHGILEDNTVAIIVFTQATVHHLINSPRRETFYTCKMCMHTTKPYKVSYMPAFWSNFMPSWGMRLVTNTFIICCALILQNKRLNGWINLIYFTLKLVTTTEIHSGYKGGKH